MSEVRLTEVVPGVLHWSARHPSHGMLVHSALLPERGIAVDPIAADGLADAIAGHGGVEQIVLTNRLHTRGSVELAERFGAAIRVPLAGISRFEGPGEPEVIAYDWGDEIADGVVAHEVGAICPDDGALHIAGDPGVLALADSVMADEDGLGFAPDGLMDDPEAVKERSLAALRRLLDLDFDVLLMAHGPPLPAGGREALAAFVEAPRSIEF